jgi:hypothetical protein
VRPRFLRGSILAALAAAATLVFAAAANASLTVNYVFTGHGGYSSDGLGQNGIGGTVQAEVPLGSTVQKAFLYGTYFGSPAPSAAQRTIDFDGTMVETIQISGPIGCCSLGTTRAEVTAQVAAKVGGGGGITNFAINNDPAGLDGVALVVVYANAALPENTIAVLDGSASPAGDTATFLLASPLDKTVPGFQATMSLGSGFSYQGGSGAGTHVCGGGQFSIVEVNSQLLSNCAGNYDDGFGNDGGLITVGGVGDLTDNPTPPSAPATDDELYNLEPFLAQGATNIEIKSSNPSNNDNLFLSVISITARAQVSNEDCDNGIDDDGDGLIDGADPDCQLPPPTGNSCGEIRGDGRLSTNSLTRFVFYNVKSDGTSAPSGEISFSDRSTSPRLHFTSTAIMTLVITGNHVKMTGTGVANGVPVDFVVEGDDGSPDMFSVTLSNGYSASGSVASGRGVNIKPCDPPPL